jgi:hypothetical protein
LLPIVALAVGVGVGDELTDQTELGVGDETGATVGEGFGTVGIKKEDPVVVVLFPTASAEDTR